MPVLSGEQYPKQGAPWKFEQDFEGVYFGRSPEVPIGHKRKQFVLGGPWGATISGPTERSLRGILHRTDIMKWLEEADQMDINGVARFRIGFKPNPPMTAMSESTTEVPQLVVAVDDSKIAAWAGWFFQAHGGRIFVRPSPSETSFELHGQPCTDCIEIPLQAGQAVNFWSDKATYAGSTILLKERATIPK